MVIAGFVVHRNTSSFEFSLLLKSPEFSPDIIPKERNFGGGITGSNEEFVRVPIEQGIHAVIPRVSCQQVSDALGFEQGISTVLPQRLVVFQ